MDTKQKLQSMGIEFLLFCIWSYFYGLSWGAIAILAIILVFTMAEEEAPAKETNLSLSDDDSDEEVSDKDYLKSLYEKLEYAQAQEKLLNSEYQIVLNALTVEGERIRTSNLDNSDFLVKYDRITDEWDERIEAEEEEIERLEKQIDDFEGEMESTELESYSLAAREREKEEAKEADEELERQEARRRSEEATISDNWIREQEYRQRQDRAADSQRAAEDAQRFYDGFKHSGGPPGGGA